MEITEVRIKLEPNPKNGRLLAYCNVVFDDAFLVHDVKILNGDRGKFVAMPSRHTIDHCHDCDGKNATIAKFCNWCGARLDDVDQRVPYRDGRSVPYVDICHPVSPEARKYVADAIIAEYEKAIREDRYAQSS